jgi:hypothetical protein
MVVPCWKMKNFNVKNLEQDLHFKESLECERFKKK